MTALAETLPDAYAPSKRPRDGRRGLRAFVLLMASVASGGSCGCSPEAVRVSGVVARAVCAVVAVYGVSRPVDLLPDGGVRPAPSGSIP